MDQQPNNHNVGVGGHPASASLSATQPQSLHPAAANGERGSGTARTVQSTLPVISAEGLSEAQTPDQASPALSDMSDWDSSVVNKHSTMSIPEEQPNTNVDYLFDAYSFVQTAMDPGGRDAAESFVSAAEQPPITPESLAELDMPRIINNPKLRHDVNFDRELSFRPNLDGSKGRQKLRLADEYWKALEAELFLYKLVLQHSADPQQQENEAYWQGILGVSQKRLAKLFHAIRDILKTLVPDCDQKSIDDRLDVDLIMRQILNAMFDLMDLGSWLAKIIKNHCAPMRDVEVDRMQATIKESAGEDQPLGVLVKGIRQLLTLLENMKLDVANHQIRHMRPLLVEDTVNFQRRYNAHRISMGKIDVPRSRLWFEHEMEALTTAYSTPTHVEALTSALLKGLVFTDHFYHSYPQTFYLDQERLRAFRTEIHAQIFNLVCKEVLYEMAPKQAPQTELEEAAAALENCVNSILDGCHGRIGTNVEYVAAEIMRLVLFIEKAATDCDPDLMDFAQQRLETDLRTQSPTFKKHAEDVVARILPKMQTSVTKHIKYPALRLQDLLVPHSPPSIAHHLPLSYVAPGYGAVCDAAMGPTPVVKDEELIRRFTHVVVLHWQVWAELVYLAPHNDEGSDNDGVTPPSSGNTSPTVPVAQAVYEPGRKWLPVALKVTDVPSGLPTPAASPASAPTSLEPVEAQSQLSMSDSDEESDRPVHSGASSTASFSGQTSNPAYPDPTSKPSRSGSTSDQPHSGPTSNSPHSA